MKRVAVALVGLGSLMFGALPWADAASQTVTLKDVEFSPSSVQIAPGDTVTWTHRDGQTPHSITADDGSFDHPPGCVIAANCMVEGDPDFSKKFDGVSPGHVISYYCKVHTSMRGEIRVVAPVDTKPTTSPSPSPKQSASPSPSPSKSPSPSPSASVSPSPSPSESGGPTGTVVATGSDSEEEKKGGIGKIVAIVASILAVGSAGGLWYLRKTPA